MSETFHVLLVIPAYRESARLPAYLRSLVEELGPLDYRLLVVDDGSGAEEQARIKQVLSDLDAPQLLPLLPLASNQGKGAAVRAGWAKPFDCQWLAFVDADGAIPAREVRRFLELTANSSAALFASRIRMLGRTVERSLRRHLTGRIFASMVGAWITPLVYDSQCGLKAIRVADYRRVEKALCEDRFCFDVELLAALLAHGIPVEEVPVDWHDQAGSKVSMIRDPILMALGVLRIWGRQKRGEF